MLPSKLQQIIMTQGWYLHDFTTWRPEGLFRLIRYDVRRVDTDTEDICLDDDLNDARPIAAMLPINRLKTDRDADWHLAQEAGGEAS